MRERGADATAIARRSFIETARIRKKEAERAAGLGLRPGAGRRR